jgi:hypothetical protein
MKIFILIYCIFTILPGASASAACCDKSLEKQDFETLTAWYEEGIADFVGTGFFYDCCNRTVFIPNGSTYNSFRMTSPLRKEESRKWWQIWKT